MKTKKSDVFISGAKLTQECEVLNLFIYGNLRASGVKVTAHRGANKKVLLILEGVDICTSCGNVFPPNLVALDGECNDCKQKRPTEIADTKSKA